MFFSSAVWSRPTLETNLWTTERSREHSKGLAHPVVIFSITDIEFLVTAAPRTVHVYNYYVLWYFQSQTGPRQILALILP